MRRSSLLACTAFFRFLVAGAVSVRAQEVLLDAPLTEAQAAREVRIAKRAITALHPALTKYRAATDRRRHVHCDYTQQSATQLTNSTGRMFRSGTSARSIDVL
jgi:hypothetical protein